MESNEVKILAIIPINKYDDSAKELIGYAIGSIPKEIDIKVSVSEELKGKVEKAVEEANDGKNVSVVSTDTDSYTKLVNVAVSDDYEWFTILDITDSFTPNIFKNFLKEAEFKSDVSVFLSLQEIYDFDSKKFIRYGNEAPWASSFSNEIGFIDNECIQEFFDFFLSGAFFNVKDWRYVNALKESFKIAYWYEFLLRLTQNGKKAFVIPKLGVKHLVNNDFDSNKVDLTDDEIKFWFEQAKQEYFYKKDRGPIYKQES